MLTEVLQLKNQLALAQAQRESFINMRQIPEEQHLAIVAAKDALIKELVRVAFPWFFKLAFKF